MYISDLIAVSVATLSSAAVVGTDLYCQADAPERAVLYCRANIALNSEDLERLRQRGITKLYISSEGRREYQKHLRDVASGSGSNSVTMAQRSAALNEVVLAVLEESFVKGDTSDTVETTLEMSQLATRLLTDGDFATGDLFRVLHHDYATFTHSANVAYYLGILATALGYTKKEVEEIVAGGLLHDLGKLKVDEKILAKPGKLDDAEFELIKKHPRDGFSQLADRKDLTIGQLMMVYQHHEKIDGRGYPVGCVSNEIHPWAKMCAVVDIYEAVTSQRPYRKPMPWQQACELLKRESGTSLEKEIVECWTSIIKNTMQP
ncbi:MAG TPA: metal-dependent phosphohydrolase [Planctomycetaceae bacterium]|nr:metal-dependent phosphohydrolase [Planctomycetaceae bacterium]